MTREQFMQKMEELQIKPKHYSIDGEIREYAKNLEKISENRYAVYYLERGEKSGEHFFSDVEGAYDDLYERIKESLDLGCDLTWNYKGPVGKLPGE